MDNHDERHRSPARTLVLIAGLAVAVSACASGSPAASSVATATSSATAAPTRAPTPTPIPTLPSTTVDATVAPSGAVTIKLTSEGAPRFKPDLVTAKAGQVVFFLQSVAYFPIDHNMEIGTKFYEPLAKSALVHPDKAAVFTVEDLAPGTYVFWCAVRTGNNSHAGNGMLGTLTITP